MDRAKSKRGVTVPAGYGTMPGLFDGPDQAEQRTAGRRDRGIGEKAKRGPKGRTMKNMAWLGFELIWLGYNGIWAYIASLIVCVRLSKSFTDRKSVV